MPDELTHPDQLGGQARFRADLVANPTAGRFMRWPTCSPAARSRYSGLTTQRTSTEQ
jgi:hypothetical protein